MQKIQIVGKGGSGKTTLAKQLSTILGIEHYEADAYFWLPNWQIKDTEQFAKEINKILKEDSWIFCGAYFKRLDGAIPKQADTIIWLNYPPRIFVPRLIKRSMKRVFKKEKLWGINTERFWVFWFNPRHSILWINLRNYYTNGRNSFREKIAVFGQEDKILEFRHPKELEAWLKNL